MTTKKKTSSTNKSTKRTKKKPITKKISSAKKKVSTSKKKKSSAKKKSPAKARVVKKPAKKSTKKKTTIKKSKNSIPADRLFVMTMNETESETNLHVFPDCRTLINQLPVVDLDKLHQNDPMPSLEEKEEEIEVVHVAMRSRVAFYLGIFLGAIVVNVFLVTILAVMSA